MEDLYIRELDLTVYMLMEIYAVCPHFDNVTSIKTQRKTEHWSMKVNDTFIYKFRVKYC